ncbi:MAG: L-lactate dehydrogenase [Bacillota bacterium]
MERSAPKVTIVGAGFVGATAAYALAVSGSVSELVLIDINRDKALGEVMDLQHGASFFKPIKITAGDYADAAGSDMIIITAGASQRPGETRLDLSRRNTDIFKGIIPAVVKACPEAILLVVSNPVDILTYVTLRLSGLPAGRVLGSGTVLDSSRFRQVISEHCGVEARNIHAYVIGEHGDTEVAVWSLANIAGVSINEFCRTCDRGCLIGEKAAMEREVRNAGYAIIEKKGATYYAVGLAVRRIVEAVLRDESSILTVSGLLMGQYGLTDVCLSLPAIVNRQGIVRMLELPLNDRELAGLSRSAGTLRDILGGLHLYDTVPG